jgi:hypothetical protein
MSERSKKCEPPEGFLRQAAKPCHLQCVAPGSCLVAVMRVTDIDLQALQSAASRCKVSASVRKHMIPLIF